MTNLDINNKLIEVLVIGNSISLDFGEPAVKTYEVLKILKTS